MKFWNGRKILKSKKYTKFDIGENSWIWKKSLKNWCGENVWIGKSIKNLTWKEIISILHIYFNTSRWGAPSANQMLRRLRRMSPAPRNSLHWLLAPCDSYMIHLRSIWNRSCNSCDPHVTTLFPICNHFVPYL